MRIETKIKKVLNKPRNGCWCTDDKLCEYHQGAKDMYDNFKQVVNYDRSLTE